MRLLSLFATLIVLPASAIAETTVPISGIGTNVTDGGFTIATHVDRVTYSAPRVVDIPGFGDAVEIRGTVSGIGWGGSGALVARAANKHYAYDLTYVARWRRQGNSKTLVMYHHGGPPPIIALLQRDKLEGAANPNRFAELLGDDVAGGAALLDHGTYIAVNRRGMTGDGGFAARYLTTEVPPLTDGEVTTVRNILAAAPGNPNYNHLGVAFGAPVPCSPSTDPVTMRDVDRALQLVVARVADIRFKERIFVGQSAGSVAGGGVAFGRNPLGALSVKTGGNFWNGVDAGAGLIFDGFIFNGFVYLGTTARADDEHPITAPAFFIQGRADERYQQPLAMLDELRQKDVTLAGNTWLYEIRSLTHVTRDSPAEVKPPNDNGERLAAYFGAAIRNMRALLRDGEAPPKSWIAGRIDETDRLVFDTGDVPETSPLREDPDIDTISVEPTIIVRPIGTAERDHWRNVTAVLPHVADAIAGPAEACRVGGYKHHFFGSEILPFPPDVLDAIWGSFRGYRQCVRETVDELKELRLYDPRVESPAETAERMRKYF